MATFYGSDSSCLTDIGLIDQQITDPLILIGQRVARRLQTPRGALAAINDDPNFGWDVRQYLLAKLSPAGIAQAQQQVAAECQKDEQVQSATVVIQPIVGGGLQFTINLVSAAGPFTLTLNVSQLTTSAIFTFQ